MFDQLVESNTAETEFKPRRKFFLVSSVIVGILFITAVVASIYAADYNLGTDNFDIAELLAPVAQTEPIDEPEPPRQQPRESEPSANDITTRQTNMARVDEPTIAPTGVSVERNQFLSRPVGTFIIKNGPEVNRGSDYDGNLPIRSGSSSASSGSSSSDDESEGPTPPAPPKIDKPKTVVSDGVINGKATYLPKPIYSAAAIAVGAKGAVNVQITIDEQGNVISAKAVSGNPLLRPEAEKAAWKAKFSTTFLSKVPVKVTGVIVYNFTRN